MGHAAKHHQFSGDRDDGQIGDLGVRHPHHTASRTRGDVRLTLGPAREAVVRPEQDMAADRGRETRHSRLARDI